MDLRGNNKALAKVYFDDKSHWYALIFAPLKKILNAQVSDTTEA